MVMAPVIKFELSDLRGHMTSDFKSATFIILVSMCILHPTASKAMVASKRPRSHMTSDLTSATLITLVSMCILPPMASE